MKPGVTIYKYSTMYAIIFTGYETSSGLERVSGAYRIATILRREGWDVEVVDFFYHWNLEQLKELIKLRHEQHGIDWLGFSCTWLNYSSFPVQDNLVNLLSHVKSEYPEIVTIAGGQNPSLHFPFYNDIDWVISGFAEVAIIEVLKQIYGNGRIIGTPRKNGWYVDANTFYKAWPISDLTIDYEPRDFLYPNETLGIEFSRGCKFSCAFCNFPVLGVKEDTTRDLNLLELELKRNYDNYGIQNYCAADETFNDREEKIIKIGNIVKNIGFEINLNAFIRADILFSKPQQLDMLSEARVWGHYYGIETMNHETGKLIGKGMHPDKIKEGLLKTKEHFYKTLGRYRGTVSLIFGLPKESKESILSTIDWLANNWSDQNVLAFPLNLSLTGNKSKLDENYEKYGYKILSQERRSRLSTRHNFFANDLTVWENEHMNLYDAIDLVDKQLAGHAPGALDNWSAWSLFPIDNIDNVLALGQKSDLSILERKVKEIKDNYITSKLSL